MNTATANVKSTPSVSQFGEQQFLNNAKEYGSNSKRKRAVDLIVSIGADKAMSVFSEAMDIIEQLQSQAENGSGYTPDVKFGFGSDNAATIANKILGQATSAGHVRKTFAGLGK